MRTIQYEEMGNLVVLVHGLVVLVHGHESPASDEWREYLDVFVRRAKRGLLTQMSVFVVTPGVAPNAKQRRMLAETLHGASVKTAVVSDAAIPRAVVTAMSWFNPGIRAFHPSEMDEAARYLGVETRIRDIQAVVDRLQKRFATGD